VRFDPALAPDIKPLSVGVRAALLPAQVGAAFTGAFGALGMFLTMMGIYGVVSFTVAQRRREIGIRKAVGATTRDIVLGVMGNLSRPVGIGLIVGLAVGVLGARALGGFIVGVSPMDPATIVVTSALSIVTAAAASAIPAVRASRVAVVEALRKE
jgi:ABC-type antimicrobial peptide transport system permease subunit